MKAKGSMRAVKTCTSLCFGRSKHPRLDLEDGSGLAQMHSWVLPEGLEAWIVCASPFCSKRICYVHIAHTHVCISACNMDPPISIFLWTCRCTIRDVWIQPCNYGHCGHHPGLLARTQRALQTLPGTLQEVTQINQPTSLCTWGFSGVAL